MEERESKEKFEVPASLSLYRYLGDYVLANSIVVYIYIRGVEDNGFFGFRCRVQDLRQAIIFFSSTASPGGDS